MNTKDKVIKIKKRMRLNLIVFLILISMVFSMDKNFLEISRAFGQPLDSSLPVPKFLNEIASLGLADYGDDAYYFAAYDDNAEIIYTANEAGEVTSAKKSPSGATVIPLVGLQSTLYYVSLEEMQHITSSVGNKDLTALGRKKAQITRSMDNYEARLVCDLMLGVPSQEVELATADDIYSGIMKMAHKVIDYGDNFVLLCGSTVWEAINTYDRDHVQSFNFRLGIREMCKDFGITIVKVVGNAALDTTTDARAVLSVTKAILVARNSTLVAGKPCIFVRRKIDPAFATQLGIPVDEAQRIVTTIGGLSVVNNSKNILGYGVVGYESIAVACTNYKAIAWCDELTNPA